MLYWFVLRDAGIYIPGMRRNPHGFTTAVRIALKGESLRKNKAALTNNYQATGPASARVRLISTREATPRERRFYEEDPR